MRTLTIVASLTVLAFLTAFTVPTTPVGPGAIKTMLETFMKAVDSGDREAAHACLAGADCTFPVLVYDLDLAAQPVAVEGREGVSKYLDGILDQVTNEKVKVESKITKIHPDCHSPELGYATMEFSQTITVDGKVESRDYRATVLVTWGKDQSQGPKIFHWHGSQAKLPKKHTATGK